MSQDAESPDRPLVVVFYGWLVPKLTENRWCGSSKLFLGNPPLVNLVLLKYILHPWNLTWNLKRSPWKRWFLLETIIFRFHVKFRGSIWRLHTICIFFRSQTETSILSSCLIRNTSGALTIDDWLIVFWVSFVRLPVELGAALFVSHRDPVQKE